ncbi:MAG: radical SAM protein [Armatimonadetes bacterium]|nr:radical SAM protein [Armatimonadota bacterium]
MKYTFRNEKARLFPEMVHIEICTKCNYKCIHCPQGDPEGWIKREAVLMKKEHFCKVVDEVSRHRGILRMTTNGEPLLHPDIREFLNHVRSSNLYAATLTTNGALWNDEMIGLVVRPSNVKLVLDFSLDGLYKGTYEKIRRARNYVTVLKNILSLTELRNRRKAKHLHIMVNAIEQPSLPKEELDSFRKFWEPIVDRVIVRKYVDVRGLVGKLSGPMEAPPPERWPCVLLWTRIAVNPMGQIRFCIDDWNDDTVLGDYNIERHTIADVWKKPELEELRKFHLKGTFGHPACLECRNWEGLRWDYDYGVALRELFSHKKP